ncbi:hypothetical protein Ccrd_015888 [Cynara cardunculus var. scolymus]|uniref:Uncharacterized protein n=2 Tax=Cynara cardunculus var. scolymus TaxID=59895 RepID=A0A103YAV9_CYNCS|nr:hypothetical protein Ccrd_015888 [Cynara cardunculus var. scolymus]
MRNKGKVYPSSSSSCTPFPAEDLDTDSLSVLKLLPATILGLALLLSLQDRQVLAYMITRSINSTHPSVDKKKPSNNHNPPPLFYCDCFDCYTSYWFKWDSSPNRELIHQAIEAFEETLTHGEQSRKKAKKRERIYSPPPERLQVVEEKAEEDGVLNIAAEEKADAQPPEAAVLVAASQHKGLARKVLPDVIGLFHWRLWSLWSPNVSF